MVVYTTNSFNKDISKIRDKKLADKMEQVIKKMEIVHTVSELPGIKKLSGHLSVAILTVNNLAVAPFY